MKTPAEKLLLALLALIVLGAGNFYGYEWLSQRQHALTLRCAELRADKAEAMVELQGPGLWIERKNWVDQHQPVLADEGTARAQVLESALRGARDQHLEILEQTLNDVQHGASGTRIIVALRVKGPMQGLCAWLADLEKPASFNAVTQISLKADEDQKSMVCTIQLTRYFKAPL